MGDGSRRPVAAGAGASRPPSGADVERDPAGLDPPGRRRRSGSRPRRRTCGCCRSAPRACCCRVAPIHHDPLVRIASLLVLAVSASALAARSRTTCCRFVVAIMGRLPIVTPSFVYAAILSVAGLMIVPPLLAFMAAGRPLRRPWMVTAALLYGAGSGDRRRVSGPRLYQRAAAPPARAGPSRTATRRGDLGGRIRRTGPRPRARTRRAAGRRLTAAWPPAGVPWGRYSFPFVFRATGPSLGPAPAAVSAFAREPLAGRRADVTVGRAAGARA